MDMINNPGKSIAAASDSISRNGLKNTIIGGVLVVSATLIWLKFKYIFNKKENDDKYRNTIELNKLKHENTMKEMKLKNDHQKELIKYKAEQKKKSTDFDSTDEADLSGEDASVASYDDIVSGDNVEADDLRLGLRCFHIGNDCGLIGRTQIGKTSWAIQYSMALARGDQDDEAKLTPDWQLSQQMTVLYFAFEQDRSFFKSKYGSYKKSIPNMHIEVKTSANDFRAIRNKIIKMQTEIGDRRLFVVFDNITKMRCAHNKENREFFSWLEDYRIKCVTQGCPITYLKIYHTQGKYTDNMPLEATNNYGTKADPYFSHDLVGFGMCKGGDGRKRYIKEIKNKLERGGEKQTLSVYKFADKESPMFDYDGEAEEYEILPSKSEMIRGVVTSAADYSESSQEYRKRGRKENLTKSELQEIAEELKVGFSWREILENRGFHYGSDKKDKEELKNKTKSIRVGFKRYGIDWKR